MNFSLSMCMCQGVKGQVNWTFPLGHTFSSALVKTYHIKSIYTISLGLTHSNVKGSIMYPFYGGFVKNLKLHANDIARIQNIYGKPGNDKYNIIAQPENDCTSTDKRRRPLCHMLDW